jgi:hypothetical protein
MEMIKYIKDKIRIWWKKHIADYPPKEIEDIEFSEKFRKKQ